MSRTCFWPGRPENTSVPQERQIGPLDTLMREQVLQADFLFSYCYKNIQYSHFCSVRNKKVQFTPDIGTPVRGPDFCGGERKKRE